MDLPAADARPLADGKPTLPARVVQHVLALIRNERLKPGDIAPSELQIGRDLHVSRGSVREAYRTLAALGVLEIEGGRRPRLQALGPGVLAEVFDYALHTGQIDARQFVDVRCALEVHAAELAARHATDMEKTRLHASLAELRQALDDDDPARCAAADRAIHATLAEAGGNPLVGVLLAALCTPLREPPEPRAGTARRDAGLVRVADAYASIIAHVCDGDADGAGRAMALYFDLSSPG